MTTTTNTVITVTTTLDLSRFSTKQLAHMYYMWEDIAWSCYHTKMQADDDCSDEYIRANSHIDDVAFELSQAVKKLLDEKLGAHKAYELTSSNIDEVCSPYYRCKTTALDRAWKTVRELSVIDEFVEVQPAPKKRARKTVL